jgi:hypothetical protein
MKYLLLLLLLILIQTKNITQFEGCSMDCSNGKCTFSIIGQLPTGYATRCTKYAPGTITAHSWLRASGASVKEDIVAGRMISVLLECRHGRGYCDCSYIKDITYSESKENIKYTSGVYKIGDKPKSKYNCCIERKMSSSGLCTNERINNALCMQTYCPFTCFYSFVVDSCGDCKA